MNVCVCVYTGRPWWWSECGQVQSGFSSARYRRNGPPRKTVGGYCRYCTHSLTWWCHARCVISVRESGGFGVASWGLLWKDKHNILCPQIQRELLLGNVVDREQSYVFIHEVDTSYRWAVQMFWLANECDGQTKKSLSLNLLHPVLFSKHLLSQHALVVRHFA